jgi:hypothetical protein
MTKKQVENFLYVLAAISGFLLLRATNLAWPIKIVLILFMILFCGTFAVILEWLERREFMEVKE